MATDFIEVEGMVKWAKVFTPDTAFNTEKFVVNFYPKDKDERAKIENAGVRLKWKEDDDGEFIMPKRPRFRNFSGTDVEFTPPIITGEVGVRYIDDDGEIVRSFDVGTTPPKREGTPITIGNGTKVRMTLAVYDSAMGKGTRLESLHVLELVEYKKEEEKDKEGNETETSNSNETSDDGIPW